MNTNTEATAVAPAITGKDIAVHTVKGLTSSAHLFFTAVADAHLYAGAHIIQSIDKTQTIQSTVDEVLARTNTKMEKARLKMSGYKGNE